MCLCKLIYNLLNSFKFNILILLLLQISYGLSETMPDSIYQMHPITVESERFMHPEIDFFPKFNINNSTITEIANTLTEAIQFTPGLYLQNYGGMGGLKTVSLRGFSSQNTLVLLDGARLNFTQNGTFNFSKIPEFMIDNITIYRGGNTAFLGNNSAAGIIQLNSNIETQQKFIVNASLGSYDDYKFHLKLNNKFIGIATSLATGINYSKGNYKFLTHQFGNEVYTSRTNGQYENYFVSLKGITKILNWTTTAHLLTSKSMQGIPGAVVQGKIESNSAKMSEFDILAIINSHNNIDTGKYITITADARYNYIHFRDHEALNISSSGIDNRFKNTELHLNLLYSTNYRGLTTTFLFESNYAELQGDMLQPHLQSIVSRYSSALGINFKYEFFNLLSSRIIPFVTIRSEFINKFEPHYSSSFGTKLEIDAIPLAIRTAVSNNYRLPSFNEMYYLNYGNQNLKSEKSTTLSLSFDYEFASSINSSITLFTTSIKDQIVSIPKNPISWTAKNIASTQNYGLEFNTDINLLKNLTLNLSYTLQKPTDQTSNSPSKGKIIQYIPQELMSGFIYYRNDILNIGFRGIYVSHRFALPDNQYESMLKPYFISNFFVLREFRLTHFNFKARFEISNILDTQYEIIKNYPMTGRTLNLTISSEVL